MRWKFNWISSAQFQSSFGLDLQPRLLRSPNYSPISITFCKGQHRASAICRQFELLLEWSSKIWQMRLIHRLMVRSSAEIGSTRYSHEWKICFEHAHSLAHFGEWVIEIVYRPRFMQIPTSWMANEDEDDGWKCLALASHHDLLNYSFAEWERRFSRPFEIVNYVWHSD